MPRKNQYDSLKEKGLCTSCATRPSTKGNRCSRCVLYKINTRREYSRTWASATRKKLRLAALDAYGGKCACCGESEEAFLVLDHVNNDGSLHRKTLGSGSNIYRWARDNNYPSTLQLLCWNCNSAKHYRGKCPHGGV